MDTFKVSGRGELHLSILIETMRRENYEFQVSRPQVIMKKDEKTGQTLEPVELAIIEVPEEYVGSVVEKLCSRKGEIAVMDTRTTGMTHLEIKIPSRGLIGMPVILPQEQEALLLFTKQAQQRVTAFGIHRTEADFLLDRVWMFTRV